MKPTRHQDKIADFQKPSNTSGFSMFFLCREGAVAPNLHQKSITNRCQNRWSNRLPLGSIFWQFFDGLPSQLWFQNRCKIYYNWLKKQVKKWYDFGWIFGASWVGFGGPVGSKINKTIDHTGLQVGSIFQWFFGSGEPRESCSKRGVAPYNTSMHPSKEHSSGGL